MTRFAILLALMTILHASVALAGPRTPTVPAIKGESVACPTGGSLGIVVEKVEQAIAAQLGMSKGQGAIVVRVVRGRAGYKAGLEQYDVITHLNGKAVSARSFESALRRLKPGTRVKLAVVRRMKRLSLEATLEKKRDLPKKPRRVIVRAPSRSQRDRRSGCMTPQDPFTAEITRMDRAARDCDSKARSYERKLASLARKESGYERDMRDMQRRLARDRAAMEQRLAELEASIASKAGKIEKRRSRLKKEREGYEGSRLKILAERELLQKQANLIKQKRAEAQKSKTAPRKRREIL